MGLTRMATPRKGTLGMWLFASNSSLLVPGNATTYECRIAVPFKHKLIQAFFEAGSIEVAGTLSVALRRATVGATRDGSVIGTILTGGTLLPPLSDLISKIEIPLVSAGDKDDQPNTKSYHLSLTGSNAGDLVKAPMLAICVVPIPRNAL